MLLGSSNQSESRVARVAHLEEAKILFRILVGKFEGKNYMKDIGVDGKIIHYSGY
jgi:hypothetical protein